MDLDALRQIKQLNSLAARQLGQVSQRLVWRRYAPGELILPHQVPLHLSGLVYRGRVEVAAVQQGRRRVIHSVRAGESIDDELWSRQVAPIELRATEPTTLCFLPPSGRRFTVLSGLPPGDLLPATFPKRGPRLASFAVQTVPSATSTVNRTSLRILFFSIVLLFGLTTWYWQSIWRIPLSKVIYSLASRRLAVGEYTDALSLLQVSLDVNPRLASAYNDTGYVLYQRGRLNEAQTAFRQAVATDPTFAVAQNNLGFSYLEDDRLDLACEALQQAVVLNPESLAAWANLGKAEKLAGRPEQAIRAYRAALRLDPHNIVAQANLGVLYYEREQFPEARKFLETTLDAQPSLVQARAILGAIALSEDDHARAWDDFQAASSYLADDPLLHFYLALWYEEAGMWKSAQRELDRVLTLQPHSDLAALVHSHLAVLASYD